MMNLTKQEYKRTLIKYLCAEANSGNSLRIIQQINNVNISDSWEEMLDASHYLLKICKEREEFIDLHKQLTLLK